MKMAIKRRTGQAMVEYIIIVVVVAVAALVVFGLFGDRIRQKLGGAVNELSDENQVEVAEDGDSLQDLKQLGEEDGQSSQ